ncbi:MAG: hypothetical protein GY754_35995 [bacterium]|nr:hypothetical protein [bacterium]
MILFFFALSILFLNGCSKSTTDAGFAKIPFCDEGAGFGQAGFTRNVYGLLKGRGRYEVSKLRGWRPSYNAVSDGLLFALVSCDRPELLYAESKKALRTFNKSFVPKICAGEQIEIIKPTILKSTGPGAVLFPKPPEGSLSCKKGKLSFKDDNMIIQKARAASN